MPFINLAKKKDKDQKVTPAEPVVSPQAEPVVDQQVQLEEASDKAQAEAPAVGTEVATEDLAVPAEANNNNTGHEGSMEVPTVLPGQEVKVSEEGVKEIKGPPLPGDTDTQATPTDSSTSDAASELATPLADTTDTTPSGTDPIDTTPVKEEPAGETLTPLNETLENTQDANPGTSGQMMEGLPPITPVTDAAVEVTSTGTSETPVVEQAVITPEQSAEAPAVEQAVEQSAVALETAQVSAVPSEEEVLAQSVDPNTANIDRYFDLVLQKDASDLHFGVGYPAFIRVDGVLEKIGTTDLEEKHIEKFLYSILSDVQKKTLKETKEVDLSYEYKKDARFRINAYFEKGNMAAAFRYLPTKIRSVDELKLPQITHEFIEIPQGFVLVTGPTGSGKSTTIAAMVQEINAKHKKHIISIEDPIEYVYPKGSSLVDQREMNKDTLSWDNALRAVLRQDPNVVVVGEMRDFETIASAITVAETGHLVFATLHTNTAVQTIDRIIDVFPQHQQSQVRSQLSNVISAVISQRLIPVKSGGRRAVTEIMIGTPAVRNAIREGKTYQIDNIIQTSFDVGMITLERALVELIREGELTIEEAQKHTTRPEELVRLMKKA